MSPPRVPFRLVVLAWPIEGKCLRVKYADIVGDVSERNNLNVLTWHGSASIPDLPSSQDPGSWSMDRHRPGSYRPQEPRRG